MFNKEYSMFKLKCLSGNWPRRREDTKKPKGIDKVIQDAIDSAFSARPPIALRLIFPKKSALCIQAFVGSHFQTHDPKSYSLDHSLLGVGY